MSASAQGAQDAQVAHDAQPGKKKSPTCLLIGCGGCGFLLLLAGVGGTMLWLLWQQGRTAREMVPDGWRDSLHAVYQLPDVVDRLATPATEDGDAVLWIAVPRVFRDSVPMWRSRAVRRLSPGATLDAADSSIILATLRDRGIDSALTAARQSRYEVIRRLDDLPDRPRLMPPLGPGLLMGGMPVSRAADRLILRGEARRWRGDLRGARTDFMAVMALARLAWRNEVADFGTLVSRRVMRAGAEGLQRVARQSRDSVLLRDASELVAWVGMRSRPVNRYLFQLSPDSQLAVAQDTILPRGIRASALETLCPGASFSPLWRIVAGPSRHILGGVRALTSDPDPVLARVAVIADSTLDRMDRAGVRGRWRLATGRQPR